MHGYGAFVYTACKDLLLRKALCRKHCRAKLLRQLALAFDAADDLFLSLLEAAEVFQPLLQCPQGGIIHAAMGFLSVSCNKRDCISFIDQCDDVFHRPQRFSDLLCDLLGYHIFLIILS